MKESQLENKTAIATNDYVRIVDENGNSVKIKKDSFMAAIRDALPSIISDGETGGGSVLSIIGGALKSRTDANLASVLGGVTNGTASPFSFSIHHSGDCRNVTNSPVSYGVIMKCTLSYYPVWMAFASTPEGIGAFWVGMTHHGRNELSDVSWRKLQFES